MPKIPKLLKVTDNNIYEVEVLMPDPSKIKDKYWGNNFISHNYHILDFPGIGEAAKDDTDPFKWARYLDKHTHNVVPILLVDLSNGGSNFSARENDVDESQDKKKDK